MMILLTSWNDTETFGHFLVSLKLGIINIRNKSYSDFRCSIEKFWGGGAGGA